MGFVYPGARANCLSWLPWQPHHLFSCGDFAYHTTNQHVVHSSEIGNFTVHLCSYVYIYQVWRFGVL